MWLSDFHKMNLTVMKVFCNKQKPKINQYRKYKDFSNEAFMHQLALYQYFLKFYLARSKALLIIYFKNMLL